MDINSSEYVALLCGRPFVKPTAFKLMVSSLLCKPSATANPSVLLLSVLCFASGASFADDQQAPEPRH